MPANDAMTYWQNMANEARAGRVSLDPEIGPIYDRAAQELINILREVERDVRFASQITGLGDFPFADTVARVFTEILGGQENSIASTTREYAEVLDKMREAVNLAVARTVHQDAEHGQILDGIHHH